jgi:paraquat-inducible protein B
MIEAEAKLQSKRHISGIWLVPIVAVLLGAWLIYEAIKSQGPQILIHFNTAEGLEIDKTQIKYLNVLLGKVSDISLDKDMQGIWVTANMDPDAKPLLREDTQFWVVRPRISGAGVSGLSTIVSGAYIELGPGIGKAVEDPEFRGLAEIPFAPAGTPGLRIKLVSATTGSLGAGAPVLYRGYQVGVVESAKLDVEQQQVSYTAFINAPYDRLVSTNTHFWNASGISAQLSSQGIKVSMGSLQSLAIGGVSFDLPQHTEPGEAVAMNTIYRLYSNEASINEDPNKVFLRYVVNFSQSLRGLHRGAEVTFRGIRVGRVSKIMMTEATANPSEDGTGAPMPVLIRLEPGAFAMGDSEEGKERLKAAVEAAVHNGLRATLASGNLLTGALYIDLNYHPDQPTEEIGEFQGRQLIPTIAGGLGQIQQQISQLLEKFNSLALEDTVGAATGAVDELKGTLGELRTLLASEDAQGLPASLNDTLAELTTLLRSLSGSAGFSENLNRSIIELNRTLQSLQGLTDTLGEKPNSLIFPVQHGADPVPKAGKP